MNYRICEAEQGTPEWLADRAGCATGSKAKLIPEVKSDKEKTGRTNYLYELAEQRVTGLIQEQGFISDAMKYGTEMEPFARMAYEGKTGTDVEQVGFIRLNDMAAGCSLDGMYRAGGRIVGIHEWKCPMLKTHIGYLKAATLPTDYRHQVIHNLWVTGADWCDFGSYRQGFKFFLIRVHAKNLPIAEHDAQVRKFLAEVDQCENEIRSFAE